MEIIIFIVAVIWFVAWRREQKRIDREWEQLRREMDAAWDALEQEIQRNRTA